MNTRRCNISYTQLEDASYITGQVIHPNGREIVNG
jgi:hypothetical protein